MSLGDFTTRLFANNRPPSARQALGGLLLHHEAEYLPTQQEQQDEQ